MEDWQQRVIDEKKELDDRLERLNAFLSSPKVNEIELLQKDLMSRQAGYMSAYSLTLRDRIEAFN